MRGDFGVMEDGRVIADEGFVNSVVAALYFTEAAPGPSPTAGTAPTCFDGPTLEAGAACTRGRDFAATEKIDVAPIELSLAGSETEERLNDLIELLSPHSLSRINGC